MHFILSLTPVLEFYNLEAWVRNYNDFIKLRKTLDKVLIFQHAIINA